MPTLRSPSSSAGEARSRISATSFTVNSSRVPVCPDLGKIGQAPGPAGRHYAQDDRRGPAHDHCGALTASIITGRGASVLMPYPEKCVRVAGYPGCKNAAITVSICGGEQPAVFAIRGSRSGLMWGVSSRQRSISFARGSFLVPRTDGKEPLSPPAPDPA